VALNVDDSNLTGEVTLIETRQHWIAAVRFALRPILIALAAVGLWILNSWLDFDDASFFNVINELVRWIVIILLVIAVVWLPIDLVQWFTRKYVLTNRRATRSYGLIRKHSLDTSLEQINDIGLTQSFLGRQLGYADLELFTASGAANETWDQLIDGPQFKVAVLEAKEALRRGQPMRALPDGFVVKGGTNEASRRAAGTVPQAGTAAEDERDAVVVASPAVGLGVEPQPEPVIASEPLTGPLARLEPEPVIEAPVLAAEPVVADPEPVIQAPVLAAEPVVAEPEPVIEAPVVEAEPVVADVDAVTEPMPDRQPESIAEEGRERPTAL
jgi:hypothetical protein